MERDSYYAKRPLSPSEEEADRQFAEAQKRDKAAYLERVRETEERRSRAQAEVRSGKREALEAELRERYIDAGGDDAGWRRDREEIVAEALRREVLDGKDRLAEELRATGRYHSMI